MIIPKKNIALKAVEQRILPKMREYIGDLRQLKAVKNLNDNLVKQTPADAFNSRMRDESTILAGKLREARSRADSAKNSPTPDVSSE